MQCDFCENKATVFLTQLIEGEMRKMCMCEDCAAEKGVTDPAGFSLADTLMDGDPIEAPSSIESVEPEDDGLVCGTCGFSYMKFQQVGRLGCSECYDVFRGEIVRRLKDMHKGTFHVGRVPEGLLEAHQRQQRIEKLTERLEQAIASENYEEAAGLRDEIEEIQTKTAVES